MSPNEKPRKSKKVTINKKNERHKIGDGFSIELIPTIPDHVGNNLEMFLYFQDELINVTGVEKRLYSTVVEATYDCKNRFIKEYIRYTNIKLFKYLKDPEMIYDFVKRYLLEHKDKVNYLTTINIIKVLPLYGYEIPELTDRVQNSNLNDFYTSVNKLNAEFIRQLKSFGFPADRDIDNFIDHNFEEKVQGCYNLVFTRAPWVGGFKANKAVKNFLAASSHDYLKDTDMTDFKENFGDFHDKVIEVTDSVKKLNTSLSNAIKRNKYDSIVDEMKAFYKNNRKEAVAYFSKRKPINYGVYKD